jgi:ribosomal protein S27AE
LQRILVLDIESSPIEAYVWGLWEQNISLDYIKTEWTILSYAAKWLGDSKIMYADTGGRGTNKVRDDKPLMGAIWALLNEADIVVAQNGKKFDARKINARLIMHNILPPAPYKVVDTLLGARKYFAFTSQKLAWTSKYLTDSPKSEHKKFPGFELWTECLADNPAAWAEMQKYNKRDVVSTEKVYLRLLPWLNTHPNVSAGAKRCPNCGVGKVTPIGRHTQPSGISYERLWCGSCGHWSRGKQMLQSTDERRGMPTSITT